jgi:hypothetical protein
MKRIYLLLFIMSFAAYNYGQNCSGFHKDMACRIRDTEGFKPFSQSKSATVEAGLVYKFQVVVFGGYDYKMGLCKLKGFGHIHLRILNADDQSVMYDNESDNYVETVGFSNEKTKNIILEITVLKDKKESKDVWGTRTCLGIAMYWHKTPKEI